MVHIHIPLNLNNHIDQSSQADDLWDDAQAAVRVSNGHVSGIMSLWNLRAAYRALLIPDRNPGNGERRAWIWPAAQSEL